MYEHDATEEAFKNGAEYMRSLIIDKLREKKGRAMGPERLVLSAVIELTQKLEVRV